MTEILDSNGTLITVGARVEEPDTDGIPYGVGTVIELTEPDGDVNEYGRQVAVGPFVVVEYDDGTTERWTALWNATGPWDDHRTDYTCDDVTVAQPQSNRYSDEAADAAFYAAVDQLKDAPADVLRELSERDDLVASAAHHVIDQRRHDGREPDGQRIEAGRIVPTDR